MMQTFNREIIDRRTFSYLLLALSIFVFLLLSGYCFALSLSRYELAKASEAFRDNAFALSLHHCDASIGYDPNFALAYVQRGRSYFKLGHSDKALLDYDKALKIKPAMPEALLRRAELNYHREKFEQSIADYSALINHGKQPYSVFASRAAAYCALKRYDSAISDYTEAIKLRRSDADLLISRAYCYEQLSHYNQALADCNGAIAIDDKPSFRLTKGWCLLHLGQIPEAREQISNGCERDPGNAEGYLYSGYCYLAAKDFSNALTEFGQALAHNSTDSRAHIGRAEAYEGLKQFKQASHEWALVEEITPTERALALERRASIDMKQDDFSRAITKLKGAIALRSGDCELYLKLADCYMQSGDAKEGEEACSRAIELQPHSVRAFAMRGKFLDDLHETDKANKDFETALKLDAHSFDALFFRGCVELNHNELSEAVADLSAAAKLNPDSKEAAGNLALALGLSNSSSALREHTIDLADSVADGNQKEPKTSQMSMTTLLSLGFKELTLGHTDKAKRLLADAVRKEPNDPRPRKYLTYAFLEKEQTDKALEQFQALQNLHYDTTSDATTLAESLQAEGRLKEALLVLLNSEQRHGQDNDLKVRLSKLRNEFSQQDGKITLVTKPECEVDSRALNALHNSGLPRAAEEAPIDSTKPVGPKPKTEGVQIAGDCFPVTSSARSNFVQLIEMPPQVALVW
jgi:tetratricopeptide (TPR) repeat protein